MKELGWLFTVGAFVMLVGFVALPKEEMGDVELPIDCRATVDTKRYAANTFFKTFTCYDFVGNRNCHSFQNQGGVCVKDYTYWYPLE